MSDFLFLVQRHAMPLCTENAQFATSVHGLVPCPFSLRVAVCGATDGSGARSCSTAVAGGSCCRQYDHASGVAIGVLSPRRGMSPVTSTAGVHITAARFVPTPGLVPPVG